MHKSCPAKIKAAGVTDGLADGQFRALVSVFGNVDSYGDKVMPGAFADTLADWKASGDSIPIYYSHRLDDPDFNIGWVIDAAETGDGLEVLGQLDLAGDPASKAAVVHRLLKREGGVRDFSFSYDVVDGSPATDEDGNDYFELRALKLYEVGPTPIGANPGTELLSVKAIAANAAAVVADIEAKTGRTLSAKNESTLRDALDSLTGVTASIKNVLASIDSSSADDGKANSTSSTTFQTDRETGPATSEEPPGVKGKEPRRRTPADWSIELALIELEGVPSWT